MRLRKDIILRRRADVSDHPENAIECVGCALYMYGVRKTRTTCQERFLEIDRGCHLCGATFTDIYAMWHDGQEWQYCYMKSRKTP